MLLALAAAAALLPHTRPLTVTGDPVRLMVEGMGRYLERATAASPAGRRPTRERLRTIIGAVDGRVPFDSPSLTGTLAVPARVAEGPGYSVYAVRWPVLDGLTAEGLLWRPAGKPAARVVVLADADEAPEDSVVAARLAAAGCEVLAPALIDRRDRWSGNPRIRMTNQPHREFIYRMAFEVGRHVIGYEVQKTLAAVDWFTREAGAPVGVWGYGEGGLVALYAAALDTRIVAAVVSGYFAPREELWREPIYRNVWGLLRDFGDAEIARLVVPRALIVETRPGPRVTGPSEADPRRTGAAPGALAPAAGEAVRREFDRARTPGDRMEIVEDATVPFLKAVGVARAGGEAPVAAAPRWLARPDRDGRMHRQFTEMVEYTQKLVRESEGIREAAWAREGAAGIRRRVWDEVIGRLPAAEVPLNPRSRLAYHGAKWDGYEVMLDAAPDVAAYGVLLLPRDIRAGERRPVVVVQHGLEGRAQDMFGQPERERDAQNRATAYSYYRNIGGLLAGAGFVVYSPQNPYVSPFRHLQRQANPLGLSLFSFILAQHARTLAWLATLDFVDARRIGFYGLSYGGKTAVRVPPLLDGYALSICSGDFNEWVRKVTAVDLPASYMFTGEWEIPEWDLAHVANHAELTNLMAPRPFMVERGHRDGVGIDEWVAYEFAKVRRFYDEAGMGARARIEYFNGPHRIEAKGTVDFLKEFLWDPAPHR